MSKVAGEVFSYFRIFVFCELKLIIQILPTLSYDFLAAPAGALEKVNMSGGFSQLMLMISGDLAQRGGSSGCRSDAGRGGR